MDAAHTVSRPSKVIGSKVESTQYVDRLAVRIITQNVNGDIAILHVKKGNYYKLPGGGIEADEDHCLAAQREAMEEIGCEVNVHGPCMATTEEWRNDLHQTSYCYPATLVKDTGIVELTEEEKVDGLKHEWASIDSALEKMRTIQPTSELGIYIKERDIFFLETYVAQSK